MFLFFIFQYQAAPEVAKVEALPAYTPTDSLYDLNMAETAIEDGGVDWGQVALYSLSTVGIWLADGALSWAVQKMGQILIRRELQGRAGPWSRFALKSMQTCPRWAFTQRDVRKAEETIQVAKTFCDDIEETDRVYVENRRKWREETEAQKRTDLNVQDPEESFQPPVTSTEKKKVMPCSQSSSMELTIKF